MRSMLRDDQEQLQHIEAKLAELEAMPQAEQARRQCLIAALQLSKTELLHSYGRQTRQRHLVAA